MRILIWSVCPWAKTAYAKNALNICTRLIQAGHDVAIFAFTGLRWHTVEYEGIKVFPNNYSDQGQVYLPIWCDFYKPDLVIQHFDFWTVGDYLSKMKYNLPPVYTYTPIDHDPCPPPVVKSVQGATKVIAMTKFAQEKFADVNIESVYIPHAVNVDIYKPGSKKEARKTIELPEDCFIFLSVATNIGPRKNLGNVLRAFRDFLNIVPEARNDAYLYIHAYIYRDERNKTGYNLPEIWKNLGIASHVRCTHPVFYDAIGYTEEKMADLYRSANWTILCSFGEGFGISIIESLACEVPIIHSNFSCLPEVVGPGGLPVDAIELVPFEVSSSFQSIPSTKQITERMVEAYVDWENNNSKLRDELGKKGRQHVLKNYTYDIVMPKWLELVEVTKEPEEFLTKLARVDNEIDIMIITHNHLDFLRRCIDSIYKETILPFHLIVVDDISTDGTEEYLRNLREEKGNISYIKLNMKARGGAQIMNIGLKYSQSNLIVSMNNDIIVTKGWLEEAVKCIRSDSEIGIVGMKFLYEDGRIQHAGGTFIKNGIPYHLGVGEPRKAHSEIKEVHWVSGPCVLIRRECLNTGWDEIYDSFGGHEDIDLCLRARNRDWKVVYCGKSEVYHLEGATILQMPSFPQMFQRSRKIFMSKWGRSPYIR